MTTLFPILFRPSGLRRTLAVLTALMLLASAAGIPALAEDRAPIVDVPNSDAEMNAAMAKARASLATFWASYEAHKPNETSHSLKVRFATGGTNGEHIWIADVKKKPGGTYAGRLANEPRDLPSKHEGDAVEFKDADISDWMFMRGGKIVGGETIKPLLKSMTKREADAYRALMEQP